MNSAPYPPLPYDEWKEAKTTLHLFTQIVGRVRLGLAPRLNHWWHVPFYVSSRGLTTSFIPHQASGLEFEFDFLDHDLVARSAAGPVYRLPLRATSVSEMYGNVQEVLRRLQIDLTILEAPFDPERVGSEIPFGQDTRHAAYDPEYVSRFWRALLGISDLFGEFRGRFIGKCSPVHFFWHSFDLAVTRFSGKEAPVDPGADPVTKEAYSHEVSSAGFWPGDANFPEPAFYAYHAPEPPGLADAQLTPPSAWWQEQNGGHLALYRYDDFRNSATPRDDLLAFLQSSYEAGADRAGWARDSLEWRP